MMICRTSPLVGFPVPWRIYLQGELTKRLWYILVKIHPGYSQKNYIYPGCSPSTILKFCVTPWGPHSGYTVLLFTLKDLEEVVGFFGIKKNPTKLKDETSMDLHLRCLKMQRNGRLCTPPKNKHGSPGNGPLEKEIPIGNHHFQVPC